MTVLTYTLIIAGALAVYSTMAGSAYGWLTRYISDSVGRSILAIVWPVSLPMVFPLLLGLRWATPKPNLPEARVVNED